MTGEGRTYQGSVNTSWSGEKCLAWNKQNYDTAYHGFRHSSCRNYGPPETVPVKKPWCYISNTDKRWETCDNIRQCIACDKGKDHISLALCQLITKKQYIHYYTINYFKAIDLNNLTLFIENQEIHLLQ